MITELMRAVATYENVDKLLEFVGNSKETLFLRDGKGRTALDWARICKNEIAIAILSKAMEKTIVDARAEIVSKSKVEISIRETNEHQKILMLDALNRKDISSVMEIIEKNTLFRDVVEMSNESFYIDVESEYGDTPLILAASFDMPSSVDKILSLGAKIDYENKLGHSALTWACVCGQVNVVEELIGKKCDLFRKNKIQRTALHYACLYAKSGVVNKILNAVFQDFSLYREKHNKNMTKFDPPSRWMNYCERVIDFIQVRS